MKCGHAEYRLLYGDDGNAGIAKEPELKPQKPRIQRHAEVMQKDQPPAQVNVAHRVGKALRRERPQALVNPEHRDNRGQNGQRPQVFALHGKRRRRGFQGSLWRRVLRGGFHDVRSCPFRGLCGSRGKPQP